MLGRTFSVVRYSRINEPTILRGREISQQSRHGLLLVGADPRSADQFTALRTDRTRPGRPYPLFWTCAKPVSGLRGEVPLAAFAGPAAKPAKPAKVFSGALLRVLACPAAKVAKHAKVLSGSPLPAAALCAFRISVNLR